MDKIHNEELNILYCSPNIVQVINLRKMRLAGHVAHRGRGEAYTGFWWGNLRERDHLDDPGLDGRSGSLRKKDVGEWTRWNWFRVGTGGGHL